MKPSGDQFGAVLDVLADRLADRVADAVAERLRPVLLAQGRAEPPTLLTVPEAAAYLSLGASTMWALIQRGELRALKSGRRTLLRRADLDAYVERLIERIAGP